MPADAASDDLSIVFELTKVEYEGAARRVLAELGLTYAQLSEQADAHQLDNASACQVWSIIGGTLPTDFV